MPANWMRSCSPVRDLIRLGLESRITARLDPQVSLPAVGQGVIGIECRADDTRTRDALHALDDAATRTAIDAERAFARRLGGSCQSPIAAYARDRAGSLTLDGLVAEPDGSRLLRDSITGSAANPRILGEQLAERVLAAGAASCCSGCAALDACFRCTASASWSHGPSTKPCRCAACWRRAARALFACPPSTSSRCLNSARWPRA